jgi:SAM-dependent methyltransferase
MLVEYNHFKNTHTAIGASAAFTILFPANLPTCILDIGCGEGTWLEAAIDAGVHDIMGVDGANVSQANLRFPLESFRCLDISDSFDLKRKFDLVLCLEVAEHLEEKKADVLVSNLVRHGDVILFSAACPHQYGQHHVNCQWPEYWQKMFNRYGYRCSDSQRWVIWNEAQIEPWYRQNLFLAEKSNDFGTEPRIKPVIHPEMMGSINQVSLSEVCAAMDRSFEQGKLPLNWYVKNLAQALLLKAGRLSKRLVGRK